MAVLTISNIAAKDTTAQIDRGTLGEGVDKAKSVYFNISDGKWYKMVCAGTAIQSGADGAGMTLYKGQTDDVVGILRSGLAVIDATTPGSGKTYCGGSATAGDVVDDADADTNNYRKTVLFVTKTQGGVVSNTEIVFRPIVSETVA